jgi:hypothetical protein
MDNKPDFDKIIYMLRELYKKSDNSLFIDILTFSRYAFEEQEINILENPILHRYNLTFHVESEVYIKYFDTLEPIIKSIKKYVDLISYIKIDKIKIFPDYDKIEIVNSEISPVYTDLDEINCGQSKLIDLLKKSSDSFDFQNIGNTSRTLLQKVANIVFDPIKHTPRDKKIDVSPGKFKNQLHSYIKVELAGDENRELRQFAETAINTVENAIDLANTLTHKLESEKIFAEVCVIGTISAISIVKLIEKQ